jgi:preprotein translocase subunit SecA
MNDQRKVIFEQRKEVLKSNNVSEIINSFLGDIVKNLSNEKEIYMRENQLDTFKNKVKPVIGRSFKESEFGHLINLKKEEFENIIVKKFNELRDRRKKVLSELQNSDLEKRIFLQTIDFLWRSHLQYLEHLRQVVGLRGYAQKDPLEEFKREAFNLFEGLLYKIKTDFITFLNNLEVVEKKEEEIKPTRIDPKYSGKKIGRNEPCFCGSGKKYKHCCGIL